MKLRLFKIPILIPIPGSHVTHLLAAYEAGMLQSHKAARVRSHLERCRRCRRAQEALARTATVMANLPTLRTSDTLWAKVEANLAEATRSSNLSRWRKRRLVPATAFGIALLLVGGILVQRMRSAPIATPTVNDPTTTWRVERLSGTPVIGATAILHRARLGVGESLTTDAHSRARVEVADIGQVEIAPNSQIRLMQTQANLHRLALDRGELSALVSAPPRLFFVDTPSARAVDLGYAYTLTVDKEGNSRLYVTSGHVALVLKNKETEVPAGAVCVTRKGVGTGTPFFEDAAPAFQAALTRYDFEHGGPDAVQMIVQTARVRDTLTLWYLLGSVPSTERSLVTEGLIRRAALPHGVTRDGISRLDPHMLALWKERLEDDW